MKTQKINFGKNFTANAGINDLQRLGWEFDVDDTAEALNISLENAWDYIVQTYHVEITVNENGKTFWNYVNTQKADNGIFEGSDREFTGDDRQTIKDLKQLHEEGNIWNEKNINL